MKGTRFILIVLLLGFSSLYATETLPSWYPKNYDLKEASRSVTEILRLQGAPVAFHHPDPVDSIIFSDADHTLLKTQTPILLKNKKTGQLVKDPTTGKIIRLPNRSFLQAVGRLKEKYPELPWDSYEIDFGEMGSIVAIDITPPIKHIVEILQSSDQEKTNKEFIITARSSAIIPSAFEEYFTNLGVDLDGVFAVNNPSLNERLKLSGKGLSAAQKKAVTMAAIIQLYMPGGTLKEVSFYDDGDDNLQMAMELLPILFPQIIFRFFDVIHMGDNKFRLKPVAVTGDKGKLMSAEGRKEWTLDDIRSYSSQDAPLPDEL
ncbi:MAG: hypothetical protein ACE5GN_03695 [Waddliaceae bacterium]